MRWRVAIAALTVAGAAVGIGVYAWPASAKLPKPIVIRSDQAQRLPVVRTFETPFHVHDFDLSQLIPRGSRVERVWYPTAKKNHEQVLVEWIDPHRYYPVGKNGRTPSWGLRLWSETGRRYQAVDLPIQRADGNSGEIRVALADVTGDGRPDVLFEQYPGTNHACGPHQVFTTSPRGVTTRAFSHYLCETGLFGDHGLLALNMPYYVHNDSMCCASFRENLRLRWDGRRFVQDSVRVFKSAAR
jgi:hypothetical protein